MKHYEFNIFIWFRVSYHPKTVLTIYVNFLPENLHVFMWHKTGGFSHTKTNRKKVREKHNVRM